LWSREVWGQEFEEVEEGLTPERVLLDEFAEEFEIKLKEREMERIRGQEQSSTSFKTVKFSREFLDEVKK